MTTSSFHQATKVESLGSFWYFDEENLRYLRMPKTEQPRENGWGGPDEGPLEDLVWHEYIEWKIGPHPTRGEMLRIQVPAPGPKPFYIIAQLGPIGGTQ